MPSYAWLHAEEDDANDTLQFKQRVTTKLKALRAALQNHINHAALAEDLQMPSDSACTVRIATWNLREFDASSYGKRGREAKAYIAEILSVFHLVALQEIREDLGPLEDILQLLGADWDYLVTDVTEGSAGNSERMAFIFDRRKVHFQHVAGELTLPQGQKVTDPFGERFRIEGGITLELPGGTALQSPTGLKTDVLKSGQTKIKQEVEIPLPNGTRVELPAGTSLRFAQNARVPLTQDDGIAIEQSDTPTLPEAAEIVLPPNSLVGGFRQFARTPFIASFQANWLKLNLATVHIYYGSGKAGMERRKQEIRRLTKLLADRAASDNDSDADAFFIAIGDFNIVDPEHETMQALTANQFVVPEPLQHIPGSNVKQDKHYDQIALWSGKSKQRSSHTRIIAYRAGVFDFFDTVYREDEEAVYRPQMKKPDSDDFYASYKSWRTHQMSDHLPMWVELHADFAADYLEEIAQKLGDRIAEQ